MNRDIVQRYVKRPIVIRAIQYNGANVELVREFTGGKLSAFNRRKNVFYINTVAGLQIVRVGNFVIARVSGEYSIMDEESFNLEHEIINDKT